MIGSDASDDFLFVFIDLLDSLGYSLADGEMLLPLRGVGSEYETGWSLRKPYRLFPICCFVLLIQDAKGPGNTSGSVIYILHALHSECLKKTQTGDG